MKKPARTLTHLFVAVALPAASVLAHGGAYRGPGTVAPPTSSTGAASGQTMNSPGGSQAPGPTSSAGGSAGTSTPGSTSGAVAVRGTSAGTELGPDLTRWQFWWEFHKDPILRVREAVRMPRVDARSDDGMLGLRAHPPALTLGPSREDIQNVIVPALVRALDTSEDRDITSGCLVALAKIGVDDPMRPLLPLLSEFLRSHDQELRESAALALGITRRPTALATLVSLLGDTPAGRELCGRTSVDDRTRTFAAYGMGLVASTGGIAVRTTAIDALSAILRQPATASRNLKVAVVNGLALAGSGATGDQGRVLRDRCADALLGYFRQDLGQGEQLMQAHVLPAMARLLGRGVDVGGLRDTLVRELSDRNGRRDPSILQSAALALGQLAKSREEAPADARCSQLLLEHAQTAKDQQTRYFCVMGLASIGGAANRQALRDLFAQEATLTRSWAALALGSMDARVGPDRARADQTAGNRSAELLHVAWKNEKNPDLQTALAVGLGLLGHRAALDDMQAALDKYRSDDDRAGYFCIGLALLGPEASSTEKIRELVRRGVRRPTLLIQAATALGTMGDEKVTDLLCEMLLEPEPNVAKLGAISAALGAIGDRRSVGPLVKTLTDEKLAPLSRAFAAVALGGIADKDVLPWNAGIAGHVNYRAAVETLTNGVSGILDIF